MIDRDNYYQRIYAKTASLFEMSTRAAAMVSPVQEDAVEAMRIFGYEIGIAFQIVDDLLDVEGDAATVGKPVRADAADDKPTYPAIAGIAAAKSRDLALRSQAVDALADFGPEADGLRQVAGYIVERRQ